MLNLQNLESILIKGSNGFVGRSIIEYLGKLTESELPMEVILLTREGLTYEIPENLCARVKIIKQDLLTDWRFDAQPSHIINLAADGARAPYSKQSADSFILLNRNLVNWVSRQKINPKIFHASSGACFGYKPLTPQIKSNEIKKIFAEGRIKVEEMLLEFSELNEIQVSIGRLFSFTGKNLLSKNQYAVTSFIKSALSNQRLDVLGNPHTIRSYLHQDAMSEWILRAVTTEKPNPCLQIGSNEPVTIKQLAEFIAQETNAEIDYSKEPTIGDIYIPDNTETRNKLGVGEGKGWKDAVREMITEARLVSHARD
jgi:nucleoside-diphosphate-sugar epimerase